MAKEIVCGSLLLEKIKQFRVCKWALSRFSGYQGKPIALMLEVCQRQALMQETMHSLRLAIKLRALRRGTVADSSWVLQNDHKFLSALRGWSNINCAKHIFFQWLAPWLATCKRLKFPSDCWLAINFWIRQSSIGGKGVLQIETYVWGRKTLWKDVDFSRTLNLLTSRLYHESR